MEAKIMDVSPAQAREWLGKNLSNRPLRQHRVDHYFGVIARGEWCVTNDAVCLSDTERLLNGQHRLSAIAVGERAVPMLVLFDLPEGNFHAMDCGLLRSNGDVFRQAGVTHPNEAAACARAIWNWKEGRCPLGGRPHSTIGATRLQVQNTYLEFHGEIQVAARRFCTKRVFWQLVPRSWWMTVDVALQIKHPDASGQFWDMVSPAYKGGLVAGHAARTLRDALQADRERLISLPQFCFMAVTAFNHWAHGLSLPKLPPYRGGVACPEVVGHVVSQVLQDPEWTADRPARAPEAPACPPEALQAPPIPPLPIEPPVPAPAPASRSAEKEPSFGIHPKDMKPPEIVSCFRAIADGATAAELLREHALNSDGVRWIRDKYETEFLEFGRQKGPIMQREFLSNMLKRLLKG